MSSRAAMPEERDTLDQATMERLRRAAEAATALEVIPRPPARSSFPKRVRATGESLERMEIRLARQSVGEVPSDPALLARRSALLELGASHRMLRAAVTAVADKPKQVSQLPRLIAGLGQDEPRIASVARVYFRAVDGAFSAATFRGFIQAVQTHEPLNVDELWSIGAFLKFALLEFLLEEAHALLRSPQATPAPQLMVHLKSLRGITHADWVFLVEPLIVFDTFLKQDPAGVFERMDFETRELYRKRIALVARRSDCNELQVAQAALELAREAKQPAATDQRLQRRREHVGYYLVDNGFSQLATRVGFHPTTGWRVRAFVRAHAEDFFLASFQVLTLLFIAAALFSFLRLL